MAESTNASFIPKNTKNGQRRVRVTRRIYIVSYISYILFFGTLFVVLGTFFYASQVSSALEDQKSQLLIESDRFSNDDFNSVRNFEKRLITAEKLVTESYAPSQIFASLESVVAQSVRFKTFSFEVSSTGELVVSVEAIADTLTDVLFQRDQLLKNTLLAQAAVVDFEFGASELDQSNAGPANTLIDTRLTGNEATAITFTFEEGLTPADIPYDPSVYVSDTLIDSSEIEVLTEIPEAVVDVNGLEILSETPVLDEGVVTNENIQ